MARPGDPYGHDVLAPEVRHKQTWPPVPATPGLRLVHRASGFAGRLVRLEADAAVVRGETGAERVFRLAPGAFAVDGAAVTLVRPAAAAPAGPQRTASGSVAVPGTPARVAAASRILVEGVHDAALVEKVWGADLRVEGVVVERLDGADVLADVVQAFRPGPGRRLGVLLDHLVPGSKEARIADSVRHPHVLVTGTPYVDIWQAVKPSALGISAWPTIPKGQPWKEGVCRFLGWGDPPETWRRILAGVGSWTDLEPALVGAVERLIDFVAPPPED